MFGNKSYCYEKRERYLSISRDKNNNFIIDTNHMNGISSDVATPHFPAGGIVQQLTTTLPILTTE